MSDRSNVNKYVKSIRESMQRQVEKVSPSRGKELMRKKYTELTRTVEPEWEDVPSHRGTPSGGGSESSK